MSVQTSKIPGDYSYEIFPSPSEPHRLCNAKNPSPSKDASVVIEETWLLEDAVRNGRLDKSNAFEEEIVVRSKSRLRLPSIMRRKKSEAQFDTQEKDRREAKVSPVSSMLSLSDKTNVRVHLGVHANVFKKFKLPDIHRGPTPFEDENQQTASDAAATSKKERRAKKKLEKRARIERERREKGERKNEKKKRKEKVKINTKDKKKLDTKGQEQKVEQNSTDVTAVSNEVGQMENNGDARSKNKMSRIRNIFSSGLRVKPVELHLSTSPPGPENMATDKEDDGIPANLILGASGTTVGKEDSRSQKKLSLIASDSLILNPSEEQTDGACVDTNTRPMSLSEPSETTIKEPSKISETETPFIHKVLLRDDIRQEQEKDEEQEKDDVVKMSENAKIPPTSSLKLIEKYLCADDPEISCLTYTPPSSKYNACESTKIASRQDKGSPCGSNTSFVTSRYNSSVSSKFSSKLVEVSPPEPNTSLKRSGKGDGAVGQKIVDVKKVMDSVIDVDHFKTQVRPLNPPTVKQIYVDVARRARTRATRNEVKDTNFSCSQKDTMVYPTVQDSYLDIPYGNHITSSRFKEEHSASVPSKWNCSQPANIFPAEGKGKCSESGSMRTIFSDIKVSRRSNPPVVTCSGSSNTPASNTSLGPIVMTKKIEVLPALSRSFKVAETKVKKGPSVKVAASHVGKKELPPVVYPQPTPVKPPTAIKPITGRNCEDISKKLGSPAPCFSTIQRNSKNLNTVGPLAFNPLVIQPPAKAILPEIRTKSPDFYIPQSPLSMDLSRLRYIPSDDDSEEDKEVLTEGRSTPYPHDWSVSGQRSRPAGQGGSGYSFASLKSQLPPIAAESSDEEKGPFLPHPPTRDKHHNRSKMLTRRARNLMAQTFKHVPDKVIHESLSVIGTPSKNSMEKRRVYGALAKRTAQKSAGDLMLEDCEYSENEFY